MFKHVLVPTDFGPLSACALKFGIEMATRFDAKLTLLHAYEIPVFAYAGMDYAMGNLSTMVENTARGELENELAEVRHQIPNATAILHRGEPWEQILSTINETHADLVVMGTHGHTGLRHVLLGSVTEKVVRLAQVPVMTVHAPRD
jgi:nucleotide-binding universal stress UspA family protein